MTVCMLIASFALKHGKQQDLETHLGRNGVQDVLRKSKTSGAES